MDNMMLCLAQMQAAIEAYTERHNEEPNTLYVTARLLARIEAWILRNGFVRGGYGYLSGFGIVPSGKIGWFCGLSVKLIDGDGLRWAVAREHIVDEKILKGEGQ